MTEKTESVQIAGRTLQMQAPNETQAALLHRNGVIADASGRRVDQAPAGEDLTDEQKAAAGKGWAAMGRMLDILVSLFPDPDEREWLEEQLLNGQATFPMLVSGFEQVAAAQTKPAPVKKSRATRS